MIRDDFAGPGGWDEALRMLGRSDVIGIEWDEAACATRRAAGHRTIRADVSTIENGPWVGRVEGFIGSPPCQGFSNAGKGDGLDDVPLILDAAASLVGGGDDRMVLREKCKDPRSMLVVEPVRQVRDLRPRWVALEQVPPVLALWEVFAQAFRSWGYSTWTGVLNAADFGVPQTRRRAFLIASLDRPALPPEPTHAEDPTPSLFGPERLPWVSMAAALGWPDTWEAHALRGAGMLERYGDRRGRPTSEPAPTVRANGGSNASPGWVVRTGSNSMKHSRDVADLVPYERSIEEPAPTVDGKAGGAWSVVLNTGRDWQAGGDRDDAQSVELTEPAPAVTGKAGGQWELRRRATGRAGARGRDTTVPFDGPAPALAFGHNAAAWAFERPATTIAGDSRVWPPGHKINADDMRRLGAEEAAERYGDRAGSEAIRLTERDAAALQSFPCDYPWQGTRTKRFEQIGNAVPPVLAAAVLAALIEGEPRS